MPHMSSPNEKTGDYLQQKDNHTKKIRLPYTLNMNDTEKKA